MLTVGLTGGIGSGKSTVATQLQRLGAEVVDGDVVAREVVEPGQPTLQAIADRFGAAMVRADGTLDRAALAVVVFPDPDALADLDRITGPAIAARVAALRAAVDERSVSVYDMPLLVERRLWPREHLTVVVGADEETRVRRLVQQRGLDEADARHRIARQATDAERRAAADVWIDNDGPRDATVAQVDDLWSQRLVPYNEHLLTGTRAPRPERPTLVAPDPAWNAKSERLVARLRDALGDTAARVDHVGSTAVPDLDATDVIDLQVGVARIEDADAPGFVETLARRGFASAGLVHPEGEPWALRSYASMDPGRAANVDVREIDSPGWLFALQLRDWLTTDSSAREEYASFKRGVAVPARSTGEYAAAKSPWFAAAYPRALAWAEENGWRPPDGQSV